MDASADRAPYRHEELRRLLHPRSVAVIGASTRPNSFGLRTLQNMAPFAGPLFPVNARYDEVDGRRCYPAVGALPEVPDCAVIALPQAGVADAVAECVQAGVGGVIVYAGGYGETRDPANAALQRELGEMVRGTPTRLLGPNCLGITNYACAARLMFGRMPPPDGPPGPQSIAIVAQSGSVSMSLGQAVARGIPLSHALATGNGADVGCADLVSYLVDDPHCAAIALGIEGVTDGARLLVAARAAFDQGKPLVVYKMATTEEGAAAALSHTGLLAGSASAFRAAMTAAGAVLVDRLDDVIETTMFFAKAGRPRGRGVAVVLSSGGLGVMAADKAHEHGVALPQPQGRTLDTISQHVPGFGAARNPCDVTAQAMADQTALQVCSDTFMADPAYSTMLIVHPYADEMSTRRIPMYVDIARRHGKVICDYWSTESLEGYGSRELEREPTIAVFRSLDRCFHAIAQWHAREDLRGAMAEPAPALAPGDDARERVSALLRKARTRVVGEYEAKQALAAYGVAVVAERLVREAEDAVRAAGLLGYPVALKVHSARIPHKTEAGVLRLGLATPEAVRGAFDEIMQRARAQVPQADIDGVLVQPMAARGIEVMVGGQVDPQFGPVVMVGLGGVQAELLRDTVFEAAPVTAAGAARMLRRLRGHALLQGWRGAPGVDLPALCDAVAHISGLLADHRGLLAELDVNPLICTPTGALAVDALMVRSEGGME